MVYYLIVVCGKGGYMTGNAEMRCIMKGVMRKFSEKVNVCSVIDAMVLFLAIDTVNFACVWIMYQSDMIQAK